MALAFTILGEPASKANSREIGTLRFRDETGRVRTRPTVRKSDKALAFERFALRQIPPRCRVQLTGPVRVTLRIFYASERPDLDESVVLDVLQNRYATVKVGGMKVRELVQRGVYANDRQVREKHVYHGIDHANPRTEIVIEPLTAQQTALALESTVTVEV
ncbi:crossover junction endodeoxyribonuclease RuvA [Burkholderia sp. SRS-W-2-2016]|nr:crossover junction endodeoxyribonuclease RuvA [Burkholderia sp. SRS-W-2-2016]